MDTSRPALIVRGRTSQYAEMFSQAENAGSILVARSQYRNGRANMLQLVLREGQLGSPRSAKHQSAGFGSTPEQPILRVKPVVVIAPVIPRPIVWLR